MSSVVGFRATTAMFVGPASNRGALGQVTTLEYGLLQERLKLNAASRRLS
tara:strand:+ start:516 stop:665 length:150 start_codon:yes stop_codon:yes gene_type:complete